MAHSDDTRRAVRAAFVFDQLGLEIAAMKHQVPEATARRWKREAKAAGDDWDKARGAQFLAGGGPEEVARQTLAMFAQQAQAAMEMLQVDPDLSPVEKSKTLASLADAFTKFTSANRKFMPETDRLAVAMDVIRRLDAFVRESYPQHAGAFAEILSPFGEDLARAYG